MRHRKRRLSHESVVINGTAWWYCVKYGWHRPGDHQ